MRLAGVAGVADLAEDLTAPDLVADLDAEAALLQVPVEHVVPAADVEDHVVARHVVPGGAADGQVGVAVDGRGDPAVGDGEQRLPEDVEVLQAAAVAAVGLPVDELDEVDRVALHAERPVVVDQRAPAAGDDLPLAR